MYETIKDVPEAIRDFYFEETLSEPTGEMVEAIAMVMGYDEQGNETGEVEVSRMIPEYHDVLYVREDTRPETKAKTDLERIITLGKPLSVIHKFADMVALGERWDFLDTYKAYLVEVSEITDYNDSLVPVEDDEGNMVMPELRALPDEPVKPDYPTGDDIFAPYAREVFKKTRTENVSKITVEVDGMVFDGDETSTARITKAIVALEPEETNTWVLANNDVVDVTREQFIQVLRKAGIAQTALWTTNHE